MFKPIMAGFALALVAPTAALADSAADLAAMRQEIDALRAQYEARLQALEQRLLAAERARPPAPAVAVAAPPIAAAAPAVANAGSPPPTGAAPAGANAFNPAVSLILSGLYTRSSRDPAGYSISGVALPPNAEIGPGTRGFSLAEIGSYLKQRKLHRARAPSRPPCTGSSASTRPTSSAGLDPTLYHVEALLTTTREALPQWQEIVDTYVVARLPGDVPAPGRPLRLRREDGAPGRVPARAST